MNNSDLTKLFNNYLQSTKDDWNYILPQQLYKALVANHPPCFLLDVRRKGDYLKGHIAGSVNIFWLDLFKPENLKRLPKRDCLIVIICYLGHTASQVLTLLKLLGYSAVVLKFGMGLTPIKGVEIKGWTQYGYPVEVG